MKLEKINDYHTRSGEILKINLESPLLSKLVYTAINEIYKVTGFTPDGKELFEKTNRDKLYNELISLSKQFESIEKGIKYGDLRDYLIKNKGDLGDILHHRTATCRELSCFGHIVLSMYGINTKVVNGNLNDGNAHAWLKTIGSTIIDFNKFRKIFNSKEYPSTTIISEQVLVKIKK